MRAPQLLFCQITLGGGQAAETGPASEMAQMPAKNVRDRLTHKEENRADVREVTVELPVVDTGATEIPPLVDNLAYCNMSATF